MKTQEVSADLFPGIVEDAKAGHNNSSTFSLTVDESSATATLGFHSAQGQLKGVTLSLPSGSDFRGGESFVYPPQATEEVHAHTELRRGKQYGAPPYSERYAQDQRPNIITSLGAASLLAEAGAKNAAGIMFLTGAGISQAGDAPIHGHARFLDAIGVAEDSSPKAIMQNQEFCRKFVENDEEAQRVFATFETSLQRFYMYSSTPAHDAISNVVRIMDREPHILTTNHDLKHESAGHAALKIPPYWHSDVCINATAGRAIRELVQERSGSIDVLVVTGVARDYRRLMQALQGVNESFLVLAVDNSETPPPYLMEGDYWLKADAQQALPEVSRLFRATFAK